MDECIPSTRQCVGDWSVVCGVDGRWQAVEACDAPGTACQEGVCSPCPPPGDVVHVDPQGVDAPGHGGAPGRCALRTLTHALTVADGRISLAPGTWSAASGEKLPFILRGRQHLECNGATLRGSGDISTTQATVSMEGTSNGLSDCVIRGLNSTGYCVRLWTHSAPQEQHLIERSDIGNCGGAAVVVFDDTHLEFHDNTARDSLSGIYWYGTRLSGSMTGNAFWQNQQDIHCFGSNPSVTGSSNRRGMGPPVCAGCQKCPF